MDYYIKVLLVDDDPRYAKALQERAYIEHKIELTHYEDWEEAKTELFENLNKYAAVILDALGKTRRGESGDNPQHISTAIRDINRKGRNINYYVLTAFYNKVVTFIPVDENIFQKNLEEDKLFTLISKNFRNSSKSILARKYPKTVQFIDEHFFDEQINSFHELYIEINESPDIFKDLPKLRVLNERTVDILGLNAGNFATLNELYDFIRDDGHEVREGSRAVDILRYFSERIQRVPEGIFHNVHAIYQTASSVASHSRKKETHIPSDLQVVAFKYGLLETINWVSDYLQTKNKK